MLSYSDRDTKKDLKRLIYPDRALTRARRGSIKGRQQLDQRGKRARKYGHEFDPEVTGMLEYIEQVGDGQ